MTHTQVTRWSIIAGLVAAALTGYILWGISPFLSGGEINLAALGLLLAALATFAGAVSSLLALQIHARWPSLAGARRHADPAVAVRQGLWVAIFVLILALLSFLRVLDVVFILVALLLIGFVEAFIQSRERV